MADVKKYPINASDVNRALKSIYKDNPTPSLDNIFDAFKLCDYDNLKVIWLGQDPYPQKGVATGIAFANKKETKAISPSLQVLRDSAFKYLTNLNKDAKFDVTLESWERQGVLMLNSSLTTRVGSIGTHTMIWRPVIKNFISKLSWIKPDLVYILSGGIANSFKPYITDSLGIVSTVHPSFCIRTNTPFPDVFNEVNNILEKAGKSKIVWI